MDSSSTSSVPSSNPTAAALQARLSSQTRSLIQRLENILATLLPPQTSFDPTSSPSSSAFPTTTGTTSHTQTATESLQISVETSALIRACEELMALTRGMKEIWLVGGLDTLGSSTTADGNGGEQRNGTNNDVGDDDMEVVMQAVLKGLIGGGEGDQSQRNGVATG